MTVKSGRRKPSLVAAVEGAYCLVAGMPLPYGVGAPYPVYAAPMPALYNPYATLPYPHHARMPPPQPYQPYQYQYQPQGQGQYPGQQPPAPGYNPFPQQ